eukprot:767479-Hanusia_phi.AAC.1
MAERGKHGGARVVDIISCIMMSKRGGGHAGLIIKMTGSMDRTDLCSFLQGLHRLSDPLRSRLLFQHVKGWDSGPESSMIRTPSSSAARLAAKAEDEFSRTPSRPGSASRPMSATRRRIADSLEFSNDLGSAKKNIVSPMKLSSLKGALSAPGVMGALQSTLVDADKLGTPLSRRPSSSRKTHEQGGRGPYEISSDSEEDGRDEHKATTMRRLEFAAKQLAKSEEEIEEKGADGGTNELQQDASSSSTKGAWLNKRSSTNLEEQKRLARERGRQRALLRQISVKEQEKQQEKQQEKRQDQQQDQQGNQDKQASETSQTEREVPQTPRSEAEAATQGKQTSSLPEQQSSQVKEEETAGGNKRNHSSSPPLPPLVSSSISAPHREVDNELRLSDLSPPSSADRPPAGFQLQSASRAASFAEQKRLARERGRRKVLQRQQTQQREEKEEGEKVAKAMASSTMQKEVKNAWTAAAGGGSRTEEAQEEEEDGEAVEGLMRTTTGTESFEEQKRLAQERGKQKAMEREVQRREQSRLAAEARKAEEEKAREQEAIERRRQEAEARRKKEEQEARARLEAEIAARVRAEQEEKDRERQSRRTKGMQLCEDAKAAAEKKQFSNAKALLSAAQDELRKSGMEEEEEEVITRGLRQYIERKQEEHLQVLREEEEKLLRQREARMRELEEEARRAKEQAMEEARRRTEHAWFRAAEQGKHHKLDEMMDEGSIADPDLRDEKFRTALHIASSCGHKKAVRTLLKRGANIDNQDGDGRTALVLAELNEHEDVVEYLTGKGADTSMLGSSRRGGRGGREGHAGGGGEEGVASDPLELVKSRFFAAASEGNVQVLQELLGKGMHPDVEDGQGNSALMLSTVFGHEDA